VKTFDPTPIRKGLQRYPLLTRLIAVISMLLYPVIVPCVAMYTGYQEIKDDVKREFVTLLSAAFLPWKKTK